MTVRFRWLLGLGFAAALAGGCSSSSSGGPVAVDAGDASSSGGGADDGGAPPLMDAAPAAMCDAVSLAPAADAGAAACFECQATMCMAEVAACSTDCTCAPSYVCLEQMSAEGALNGGYSLCPDAYNAIMNGNVALMNVADCASANCHIQCFGDGG